MLLGEGPPAFVHVVFRLFEVEDEVLHAAGQDSLPNFRIHAVGVGDFEDVQDCKLSARSAAEVEHPASLADGLLDGRDEFLYLGKGGFDRYRNLLVLFIDLAQQLGYAFLLKVVVERGLLRKSKCHFI